MFDVSFSELMVIAVVALIVIGPERLPRVARTAGHVLGRLQRYVTTVKADINREMQLEELKKLQQDVAEQVKTVESSMTHDIRELETSLNQTIASATDTVAAPVLENAVPPEPTSTPALATAEPTAEKAQT